MSEHVIQAEARGFGGLSVDLEERVPERRGRGLRPQPRSPRAPEVSQTQISCRMLSSQEYEQTKSQFADGKARPAWWWTTTRATPAPTSTDWSRRSGAAGTSTPGRTRSPWRIKRRKWVEFCILHSIWFIRAIVKMTLVWLLFLLPYGTPPD